MFHHDVFFFLLFLLNIAGYAIAFFLPYLTRRRVTFVCGLEVEIDFCFLLLSLCLVMVHKHYKTSYYRYARPAQPGPNRTRLCGSCIAAIAGDKVLFGPIR